MYAYIFIYIDIDIQIQIQIQVDRQIDIYIDRSIDRYRQIDRYIHIFKCQTFNGKFNAKPLLNLPECLVQIILRLHLRSGTRNCRNNPTQQLFLEFRTIFACPLNFKLYYRVNSDSWGINGKSLDANFSKQTLPESVYLVFYIAANIEDFVTMNLILELRQNLQLFEVFRITWFDYKIILIKTTFL